MKYLNELIENERPFRTQQITDKLKEVFSTVKLPLKEKQLLSALIDHNLILHTNNERELRTTAIKMLEHRRTLEDELLKHGLKLITRRVSAPQCKALGIKKPFYYYCAREF